MKKLQLCTGCGTVSEKRLCGSHNGSASAKTATPLGPALPWRPRNPRHGSSYGTLPARLLTRAFCAAIACVLGKKSAVSSANQPGGPLDPLGPGSPRRPRRLNPSVSSTNTFCVRFVWVWRSTSSSVPSKPGKPWTPRGPGLALATTASSDSTQKRPLAPAGPSSPACL